MADSNLCGLCGSDRETMIHIFTQYPIVKELWINILCWIEHKLSVKLEGDTVAKALGYPTQNEQFWPFDFILMITKQYILSCCKNKEKTNIFVLQQIAKQKIKEQKSLSNVNCQDQLFLKRWVLGKDLFIGL